jgi:hypothetical protein
MGRDSGVTRVVRWEVADSYLPDAFQSVGLTGREQREGNLPLCFCY